MLKMEKNKIIILQLLIYIIKVIILIEYYRKFRTRFKYKKFIDSLKEYIKKNNLNINYIEKFEKVFFHYDNGVLEKNFNFLIIILIEAFIIVFSLVGIIINIMAIYYNRKMVFISYCFFSIIFFIEIYAIYFSLFIEKDSLDLTDNEINEFGEFKKEIETEIYSVYIRILFLRIYSFVLLICSLGNIFLSFILFCNIKNEEKTEIIENKGNNQLKIELELINNENNHENESNEDVVAIDNLINKNNVTSNSY